MRHGISSQKKQAFAPAALNKHNARHTVACLTIYAEWYFCKKVPSFRALKAGAVHFYDTLVHVYQTVLRHVLGLIILRICRVRKSDSTSCMKVVQNCEKRLLASSCPSVCPLGTTWLPLDGFWWNLIFELLSKICREIPSFTKIWQEWRVLYMKTFSRFWQYLAEFFLKWEIFQTEVLQKIRTLLCLRTFFRKWYRLWDNVKKYGGSREATDDNIIRRMRFACWITKATEYIILRFHDNSCYPNAPHC
jgi:hypothetical protein